MSTKAFAIGDYVRFINEKQEGTIRAILASGIIVVDIEDGFPIEVLPRELVKVQQPAQEISQPAARSVPSIEKDEPPLPAAEAFRVNQELRLLVIPSHGRVTTGHLQLYLLNTTSLQLLFSLNRVTNNRQTGIAAGKAMPGELRYLMEVKRDDLIDYDQLRFIGLVHEERLHTGHPIIRKDFQLPVPDLHQRFPFLPSPYAFSQWVPLYRADEPITENEQALYQKLQQEFSKSSRPASPVQPQPPKKGGSEHQYLQQFGLSAGEIDLHIEELQPSIEGLSNAEIVGIQMNCFRQELDKAILRKAKSIVFIHGVGNGFLKSEIRKELKAGGFPFRDGDLLRYGYGATEVLL